MWADWFGYAKVKKERPPADLTALEQRLDGLESGFRAMKLEWEDVYDKLHKAAQRLNARTRRQSREDEPPEQVDPVAPPPVHGTGTHDMLAAARNRRGRP